MNNPFGTTPDQVGARTTTTAGQQFLVHAFAWMFAGLLLTAGVSFVVQTSQTLDDLRGPELPPLVLRPARARVRDLRRDPRD